MLSERMNRLTPYVPGEQPQGRKFVKLNTNENPYPPTPLIDEFLKTADIERLRLYPDPNMVELRKEIAGRYGVGEDEVFVGNGSDEVLSFAFYAFFDENNGKLLFPEHTYSFYPVYCDFYGIDYRKVPLGEDFGIEPEEFTTRGDSCGIIFPNPNAPTGMNMPMEKLTWLLDNYPGDRVVVVDEAYIDFGGESAVTLLDRYKNLLVIRTFSKSMSLAGIRLGFAMGDKKLIDAMFAVKDSFNSYPVDYLTQQTGLIALKDTEYYEEITARIIGDREYFADRLEKSGWRVLPSGANFVFAGKPGVPGEEVYLTLKERGILVRYFAIDGIKDFVRITIGTREEMDLLLKEIETAF